MCVHTKTTRRQKRSGGSTQSSFDVTTTTLRQEMREKQGSGAWHGTKTEGVLAPQLVRERHAGNTWLRCATVSPSFPVPVRSPIYSERASLASRIAFVTPSMLCELTPILRSASCGSSTASKCGFISSCQCGGFWIMPPRLTLTAICNCGREYVETQTHAHTHTHTHTHTERGREREREFQWETQRVFPVSSHSITIAPGSLPPSK